MVGAAVVGAAVVGAAVDAELGGNVHVGGAKVTVGSGWVVVVGRVVVVRRVVGGCRRVVTARSVGGGDVSTGSTSAPVSSAAASFSVVVETVVG